MRGLGLVVGVWAGVALGQAVPRVAAYPLQVKQAPTEVMLKGTADLQAEYLRLLRLTGVDLPSTFELNAALGRSKRQDCDLEDQCLAALALVTESLYGVYVSIEWDLRDTLTVAGRVVRQDGQLAIPRRTVTQTIGKKEGFLGAAKVAMQKLFATELVLKTLSPTRPSVATTVDAGVPAPVDAGVPVVVAPSPVDAGVTEVPPPMVKAEGPSAGKIAGYAMVGGGGVAAVAGVAVFLVGRGASQGQVDPSGVLLPEGDRMRLVDGMAQQRVGLVVAGVGAAVAVGGVVLLLLSKEEPASTTWWVAPVPGGAAVGVQGVLP